MCDGTKRGLYFGKEGESHDGQINKCRMMIKVNQTHRPRHSETGWKNETCWGPIERLEVECPWPTRIQMAMPRRYIGTDYKEVI